jgi:ADP-ribose pyrophosphatase
MDYQIINRQTLYDGFFAMHAYTVEHDCFAGGSQQVRRENMERGDAVAILLYDADADEVLLIEQFRIGPAVRNDNPWLLEIVAGMIDDGESAQQAACREAVEEAGYAPREVSFLGRYYTTPGACSERIELFLGLVDKHNRSDEGGGVEEEHEDIRCLWAPRERALQWLAEGKITSGAPMLALMLAFGWNGAIRSHSKTRERRSASPRRPISRLEIDST